MSPNLDERVAAATRYRTAAALSRRLDSAKPTIRECQVLYHRGCTLRCQQCFLGSKRPVRDLALIEDICRDLVAIGITPVLYPSEPLIGQDEESFLRLLDLLASLRQKILLSSGCRLTPMLVEALRRRGPPKLYLSLHGASAKSHEAYTRRPGSFEELVASMALLARELPETALGLNVVLRRSNVGELRDLVERALGWGARSLFLIPFMPIQAPGDADALAQCLRREELLQLAEDLGRLRREHGRSVRLQLGPGLAPDFHSSGIYRHLAQRKAYCRAGRQRIALDPADGRIYPCMVLSGRPELAIGHWDPVAKRPVIDPRRNPLGQLDRDLQLLKGACSPRECPNAPLCRGGCRAMAAAQNGGDLLAGQRACLTRVLDEAAGPPA